MICPKCGLEYEGEKCPRCSVPDIVVNDSDYLKRKKEYEEKQALLRSASSDKKTKTEKPEPSTNDEDEQNQELPLPDEIALQAIAKMAKKSALTASVVADNIRSRSKVRKNSSKKRNRFVAFLDNYKKLLIIFAICVILIVSAVVGIVQLIGRKNYVLYMSTSDKIYDVANLESEYICDVSEAIFESDGETFYTPEFPSDIDTSNIVQTLASDSGKYFVAVTYDEESAKYSLYIWNDSGCCKIAENKNRKTVQYVTDDGKVVYTDEQILNDEGDFGGMGLYVYQISSTKTDSALNGTLTELDDSIKSVSVYTQKNLLLYLNSDNKLYTYDYNKMSGKTLISYDVTSVYPMSSDQDYVFINTGSIVNESKSANQFIYNANGTCYLHTLGDKESTDLELGKGASTGNEFIYDKGNGYLYMISTGNISFAQITQEKCSSFETLDTIGTGEDVLYFSDNAQVVYTNASGTLAYVTKGILKSVIDGVSGGTLSRVRNTTSAFTYIKDSVQYYCSSLTADPVKMMDVDGTLSTNQTIYYKKRLYFYNAEGTLYSCTEKGKEENEIGSVEKFWLGTEYK